jgi:hypothetical protein
VHRTGVEINIDDELAIELHNQRKRQIRANVLVTTWAHLQWSWSRSRISFAWWFVFSFLFLIQILITGIDRRTRSSVQSRLLCIHQSANLRFLRMNGVSLSDENND